MKGQLDSFLERLGCFPARPGVFNPWREADPDHDLGLECPSIRRAQLEGYLRRRLRNARFLLVGEALGYQGGHFSGIAMTSERILLGRKEIEGIPAAAVLAAPSPRRTSRPEVSPLGFSEPTGTIVWKTLLGAGLGPEEFVLWNAFPCHPYHPGKGMLSNRRPAREELEEGLPLLRDFFGLFPAAAAVAVGRVAEELCPRAGRPARPVRHPANGGAGKFRRQFLELLRETDLSIDFTD